MRNREYFLREDLDTYKKKFFRLCEDCKVETLITKVSKEPKLSKQKVIEIKLVGK